jgi:preprotein translocase SecE subunit
MANITRIKAQDGKPKRSQTDTVAQSTPKPHKEAKPKKIKPAKVAKPRRGLRKVLYIIATPLRWIAKPFRAFGRYIKASWHEIAQVRWPDRKLTWKLTLTVIGYTILLATIIALLDALFSFIFNQIIVK